MMIAKLRQHIKDNKLAFAAATAIALLTFVAYLPPHYSWYYWQSRVNAILFLLTGLIQLFPLFLGLSLNIFPNYASEVNLAQVAIFSLLNGTIVYVLIKLRKLGIVIFSIGLLFNFCGSIYGFSGMVNQPITECDQRISERSRVKILLFEDHWSNVDIFLLSSIDSGETWNQIFFQSVDVWEKYVSVTCDNIGHMEENFIWVLIDYYIVISEDGGDTWAIKPPKHCFREGVCFGEIQSVDFEDAQNGILTVNPWKSDIEILKTRDGGDTWVPVSSE